jgi:hypothetical protein
MFIPKKTLQILSVDKLQNRYLSICFLLLASMFGTGFTQAINLTRTVLNEANYSSIAKTSIKVLGDILKFG